MFHRRMRRDIHEQKATRVADRGAEHVLFEMIECESTPLRRSLDHFYFRGLGV